jgi:hypothetical protein
MSGTTIRVPAFAQARENNLENPMRRIMVISAALPLLLAGTLTLSAQTQMPQEPRGEESNQSASPSGQLRQTPNERREQRSTTGKSGTTGTSPRGQSTPQEPRGEESSQSATPRGEQPRN